MPIVSVSLNERLAREMARLSKSLGFTGRSELVRAALREFLNSNYTRLLEPNRDYCASVTIVLPEAKRAELHRSHDSFSAMVRSQFHLCLKEGRCMEVLGLTGKGKDIRAFLRMVECLPKVERVSLIIDNQ